MGLFSVLGIGKSSEQDLLHEISAGMKNFLDEVSNSSFVPQKVKDELGKTIPRSIEWLNAYSQSLQQGKRGTAAVAHEGIASQARDVIKGIKNGIWAWTVPGFKGDWFDSIKSKEEQEKFRVLYSYIQNKVNRLLSINKEL